MNQTANGKEQVLLQTVARHAATRPREQMEHIPGVKLNDKPRVEILDTINQRVPLN
jgi:hypothetical protein